jgi:hypothetical protein
MIGEPRTTKVGHAGRKLFATMLSTVPDVAFYAIGERQSAAGLTEGATKE